VSVVDHCSEHCLMMQHIAESPERYKTILESKEKVHNLEEWVKRIEFKLEEVIKSSAGVLMSVTERLNDFYLKIMFSIVGVNVVMIVVMAVVLAKVKG